MLTVHTKDGKSYDVGTNPVLPAGRALPDDFAQAKATIVPGPPSPPDVRHVHNPVG